jgi:hypothetical protein
VASHLSSCPDCAAELAAHQELHRRLASFSPGVRRPAARLHPAPSSRPWQRALAAGALAAAAVLVFLVVSPALPEGRRR